MKIAVIGHLCLDVIDHPDGHATQSYGGIFFSIATLANLLRPQDTVLPIFGMGRDEHDDLIERLKIYPNVDPSSIYRFNGTTNRVHLTYRTQDERIECSRHIAEPIPWKRIRPSLANVDMILVNMISGFDITLETLDEIRMEMREDRVPIYLDLHSLSLGIREDCTRFHRPLEAWRRWAFMLHGLQMNEQEAAVITAEQLDEASLARHVLSLSTKALVITRGAHGCTAFIDESKRIRRIDEEGIEPERAVDPTGCGDVFAAAYCTHYLRSHDIVGSVQFANRIAAFKARQSGSTDIDSLANYRSEVLQPAGGDS